MGKNTAKSPLDGRTALGKAVRRFAARRREIADGLLRDLGRPVTMTDRVWAENTAALINVAEALEAQGADSTDVRTKVIQSLRAGGRKSTPAVQQHLHRPLAERWADDAEVAS